MENHGKANRATSAPGAFSTATRVNNNDWTGFVSWHPHPEGNQGGLWEAGVDCGSLSDRGTNK